MVTDSDEFGAFPRQDLLDLAWIFEPATPRTWKEHFTTVLLNCHII